MSRVECADCEVKLLLEESGSNNLCPFMKAKFMTGELSKVSQALQAVIGPVEDRIREGTEESDSLPDQDNPYTEFFRGAAARYNLALQEVLLPMKSGFELEAEICPAHDDPKVGPTLTDVSTFKYDFFSHLLTVR